MSYRRHAATVLHPVWRHDDGGQLIGQRLGLEGEVPVADLSSEFSEALDELCAAGETRRLVGARGGTWQRMSVTPWVYPAGTQLSMHYDGDAVAGAFTFYVHETWQIRWGGWLVVMHADADERFDLATSEDQALAAGSGDYSYGQVIIPIPNRAVILGPNAKHLISRVDPLAGDRLRMSLNGVFFT